MRAHHKKLNLSLVIEGRMKRIVNLRKNFVLLMIKPKNDVDYEEFQGCDPKLKSVWFEIVNQNNEMFQEPILSSS